MGPGLDQTRDPGSAVRLASVARCESDCRSRGREFDPGPVDIELLLLYTISPVLETHPCELCDIVDTGYG